MAMFADADQLQGWKEEMRSYSEARKKTGFGGTMESPKRITHKDVKTKQAEFNPILQVYATQDKEQHTKKLEENDSIRKQVRQRQLLMTYDQGFNVINLAKTSEKKLPENNESGRSRLLPNKQVDYNIITNQKLEDYFYANVKKVPDKKFVAQKNLLVKERDFNIINNKYWQEHEMKSNDDQNRMKNDIQDKLAQTHDFNCLVGKYYDDNKERDYQDHLEKEKVEHIKRAYDKIPPSMKYRESIIVDPTKEIPEEIKQIDIKKKLAKTRYQIRYQLEKELADRDIEDKVRQEERMKNRIFHKKYGDELVKGYDMITLDPVEKSKIEEYTKVPHSWDKISAGMKFNREASQPLPKDYARNTSSATKDVPEPASKTGGLGSLPQMKYSATSTSDAFNRGDDMAGTKQTNTASSNFYGTRKTREQTQTIQPKPSATSEKLFTRDEMSKSLYSGLKTEFKLTNSPKNYLPNMAIRTGGFSGLKE